MNIVLCDGTAKDLDLAEKEADVSCFLKPSLGVQEVLNTST